MYNPIFNTLEYTWSVLKTEAETDMDENINNILCNGDQDLNRISYTGIEEHCSLI